MVVFSLNFQNTFAFQTITTNRLLSALSRKRLVEASIDLTAEQLGVLIHLWNLHDVTQEDLAHMVCVDKSSLSRVLNGMERRGLVRRVRDPNDARRKILHATPVANELKEACKAVLAAVSVEILRNVDPVNLKTCLSVLAQVKENIRNLEE